MVDELVFHELESQPSVTPSLPAHSMPSAQGTAEAMTSHCIEQCGDTSSSEVRCGQPWQKLCPAYVVSLQQNRANITSTVKLLKDVPWKVKRSEHNEVVGGLAAFSPS